MSGELEYLNTSKDSLKLGPSQQSSRGRKEISGKL